MKVTVSDASKQKNIRSKKETGQVCSNCYMHHPLFCNERINHVRVRECDRYIRVVILYKSLFSKKHLDIVYR